METREFIEDLVDDGLDSNTVINFVEDQESKYLELLHTEIGFLTGVLISVRSGASIEVVLKKRIAELRAKS